MPGYGNQGGYQRGGGGSRGGSSASDNITTTGTRFVNEQYGKFMNVNFWGRCMTIEIGTVPAGTQMDWSAIKGASVFRQVVSFSSIADICEMVDEVKDAIKSTSKFSSVGVRCGQKGDVIVEISNGDNIKMPSGIYLVVYKGVDNSNRPAEMEFYPFSGTKFIRDYDHSTGGGREDLNKMGEFKKFRRVCENAADAFTMAQAHAVAEVKKGDKLATFKALSAIGAALHVDLSKDLQETKTTGSSGYTRNQNPNPNWRRGGGYQKNTYNRGGAGQGTFERGQSQQSSFSQTPQQVMMAEIVDQPVDLNMDLAQLQNVTLSQFASG